MGSQTSQEEPLALPQQQIVSLDENGHVSGGGPASASAAGCVGRFQEATAVKATFALAKGGLRLADNGTITVEFRAATDGTLEALLPGLEQPGRNSWPVVSTAAEQEPLRRGFRRGESCVVELQGALDRRLRQKALLQVEDGLRKWPVILILRPGPVELQVDEPEDGALMACCEVRRGHLEISRQLIAWGGQSSAYVMQELYGVQEAQGTKSSQEESPDAEVDGQQNCVVCLTVRKDTALLPCGHFCVCYECGVSLRLSPARSRCPLCRQEVQDIARIDFNTSATDDLQSEAPASPVEHQGPKSEETDVEQQEATPEPADVAVRSVTPSVEELRAKRLAALDPHKSPAPSSAEVGAAASSAATSGDPAKSSSGPREWKGPGASGGDLPQRCLQRLTREMRQIEEQRVKTREEHALELALADPEGNDLRTWSLRLFTEGIDTNCELGKELRRCQTPAVELEVWIPNAFPVQPPKLRVLKPCFTSGSFFVFQNGALCLEVLTGQGWPPAMSLLQLGVQVKSTMMQGKGTVSSDGFMGDPSPTGRVPAWSTFERIESAHSDWKVFATR